MKGNGTPYRVMGTVGDMDWVGWERVQEGDGLISIGGTVTMGEPQWDEARLEGMVQVDGGLKTKRDGGKRQDMP